MPKLHCPCGFIHDLSPIPDAGWITIRDQEYEALLAAEAQRERLREAKEGSLEWEALLLADKTKVELHGLLYECPNCGRVMWQQPGEQEFRIYTLEKSNV
jgi:hypothetical protein